MLRLSPGRGLIGDVVNQGPKRDEVTLANVPAVMTFMPWAFTVDQSEIRCMAKEAGCHRPKACWEANTLKERSNTANDMLNLSFDDGFCLVNIGRGLFMRHSQRRDGGIDFQATVGMDDLQLGISNEMT